jgi:hypothetical protein
MTTTHDIRVAAQLRRLARLLKIQHKFPLQTDDAAVSADEALEAAAGICDRYGLQSDGPAHDIRLLKRKQSAAPQPASEQQAARGLSDDVRSRLEFYAAGYCKSTSATDREAGKAMYALLAAKGDGHAD